MNRKRTRRIILGGLFGLLLVIFIAAKIDTFTRGDPNKLAVFFEGTASIG